MLELGKVDFFGEDARFHHVGMVVRSIASIQPDLEIIFDPVQNVNVAFVTLNGLTVELLEPASKDSPVGASLAKGIKLVHLCYEVADVEDALRRCREFGFFCIRKPVNAVAFNREIAWVFSREYGLVELLARQGEADV
jgi:methylmalonyl-CoA/ethylmalonyl-CoA epimerase